MVKTLVSYLKSKEYDLRLFAIRFVIFGVMGYVIESITTGSTNLISSISQNGFGETFAHLGKNTHANTVMMAFFVYCWAAIPYTVLLQPSKRLTASLSPRLALWLRGLFFGLVFMAIEYITGAVALFVLHSDRADMWDYSHLPLNIHGIVTFVFLPFWWIGGVLGEFFHEKLVLVDDLLATPEDAPFDEAYDKFKEAYFARKDQA